MTDTNDERRDALADELRGELRVVRNLLALLVADRHETLATKARALTAAGLAPKNIAPLLDTSPNTISVALYALSKGPKKRTKKKASPRKGKAGR